MPKRWLFIVDRGGGRLLRGETTPAGHVHLDVVDTVENRWQEHEHGRPSPLKYKDGHSHAAWTHEDETMLHRFAKDVAEWLDEATGRLGIERVALFAPPRLIGELRRTMTPALAQRVEQHEGDLGYMGPGELVRQPLVARWLGLESPA